MSDTIKMDLIFIRIISILLFIIGLFGLFGSLFMWGAGFILPLRTGLDYRFPISDILINAPTSIIAAIGLWRKKQYGYITSQFVSGFYLYGSILIFIEVIQGSLPKTIAIILPQIVACIIAIIMVFYFWKKKKIFS